MMAKLKYFGGLVLGVVLIIIGIGGLIFPVVPGWVFIIPGAMLLGFDIGWVLWALKRGELKFPRFRSAFRKLQIWVHNGRKAVNGRKAADERGGSV